MRIWVNSVGQCLAGWLHPSVAQVNVSGGCRDVGDGGEPIRIQLHASSFSLCCRQLVFTRTRITCRPDNLVAKTGKPKLKLR